MQSFELLQFLNPRKGRVGSDRLDVGRFPREKRQERRLLMPGELQLFHDLIDPLRCWSRSGPCRALSDYPQTDANCYDRGYENALVHA